MMKKGFNRLKGLATASVMSLGCIGAGSGRAATVTLNTTISTSVAATMGGAAINAAVQIVGATGAAFELGGFSGFLSTPISTQFGTATQAFGSSFLGTLFIKVSNGSDEAFFRNPDNTVDLTDNVITSDVVTDIIPGLSMQIEFAFIAPADTSSLGIIRALYTLTNTRDRTSVISAQVLGNLGTGTIQASSSGDTVVDDIDLWTIRNDAALGEEPRLKRNPPTFIITRYGTGASIIPTDTAPSDGLIDDNYDLRMSAGETQRILVFMSAHNTNAGALAAAANFETLAAANTANYLTGLTATQLSEIVNYGSDANLDGTLDSDTTNTNAAPNTAPSGDSSSSGGMSQLGLTMLLAMLTFFRMFRKTKVIN